MKARNPPQPKSEMVVVRQEFLPSARMTATARSFLDPNAAHIPLRYFSQRHAVMSVEALQEALNAGVIQRMAQMAVNVEKPLYLNGSVAITVGGPAVRLAFQLEPYSESALHLLGQRIEALADPDRNAESLDDTITVRAPRAFAASAQRIEAARIHFEESMNDAQLYHGHFFKATKVDIRPLEFDQS